MLETVLKSGRSRSGRHLQPWPAPDPVPLPRSQLQKLHFVCATFFILTPCASKNAIRRWEVILTKLVSKPFTIFRIVSIAGPIHHRSREMPSSIGTSADRLRFANREGAAEPTLDGAIPPGSASSGGLPQLRHSMRLQRTHESTRYFTGALPCY